MDRIAQNIFKAVHEGKWLSIEYKNQRDQITNYWIAIHGINVRKRSLKVEGFHLMMHTVEQYDFIYIDSILSAAVVEASSYRIEEQLVEDIERNPEKYEPLFGQTVNLKILNYLIDCNRLDTQPYQCEYSLLEHLDGSSFKNGEYPLDKEQFRQLVRQFQDESTRPEKHKSWQYRQLVMNELSILVKGRSSQREALYVLAYRKLYLDVKRRVLQPDREITISREFTVNGEKESIRKYMDPADYDLLAEFTRHRETIKDRITHYNSLKQGIDDRPYIIALARDIKVDLNKEYEAVIKSLEEGKETQPVKAFFGKLLSKPKRRKDYPLALLEHRANLDQLLAIHNAVKYPVTYVQGPPGTGKSHTIINSIITAFFNEKTVLLASYNNHPIDTVVEKLRSIPYKQGEDIPFPVIRLGNTNLVKQALLDIREQYERIKDKPVFEGTLEKNKDNKINRTRKLTELLKKYENTLALREKQEAIECLLGSTQHLTFQTDLQGRQLEEIRRELQEIGEITNEQALSLLDDDEAEFKKYLNFTSIKYLKRLGEPKNEDLRHILELDDENEKVKAFHSYLNETENVKKFLRIFPVVATSCISSHRIGSPEAHFDLTIIDEASQCSTAMSLLPVIRGKNLMLVGDPQQLNPVILLDSKDNEILKQRYQIPQEYDYLENSIYKTFLANDAVSEEILLRHHYRCCRSIIEFNNVKYYNSRLKIESREKPEQPLVYVDVKGNETELKNAAPREAEQIVRYVMENRDKKIGIITPFANQKECISRMLKDKGIQDVSCGTVHAFQGDEKDIILFSTAVTDQMSEKTYGWLKNNRELINVATSRAREKLVLFSSTKNLERLHDEAEKDDMYELARYVSSKGLCRVSPDEVHSRALGIKPYSAQIEADFLVSLNHALGNILNNGRKCKVENEVDISQVFRDGHTGEGLFYNERFDFVIYEKEYGGGEKPILAIELDGKEHQDESLVKQRDRQKTEVCRTHGFELIRVENSYARRYYYIKGILEEYFRKIR